MTSWAKPGVKCVCVDAGTNPGLKVGATYTVKEVSPYRDRLGNVGISLAEAKPILHPVYFGAFRFRPLVTRTQSQDLALFTPLLETQGVDA